MHLVINLSISGMDQMFMIHMYLKVFIQFQSLNLYINFFFLFACQKTNFNCINN